MNAKEELIKAIRNKKILQAVIYTKNKYNNLGVISLPNFYTEKQLEIFLNKLDFNYNKGYGIEDKRARSFIEIQDKRNKEITWLERIKYKGVEKWRHHRKYKLYKIELVEEGIND